MSWSLLMRFWLVRRRVGGGSIVLVILTIIITISRATAPASSSSRRIISTPVGRLAPANCSNGCRLIGGCGGNGDGADYGRLWHSSTFRDPNFVSLFKHILVSIFIKFLSCQFVTDWLRKLSMPHPEDGFGTVAPVQRSRSWTNKMYYFLC